MKRARLFPSPRGLSRVPTPEESAQAAAECAQAAAEGEQRRADELAAEVERLRAALRVRGEIDESRVGPTVRCGPWFTA